MLGRYLFPDPRDADDEGLVALGGDFHPSTLLTAYSQGIFPWPSPDFPFVWVSPDPRLVLRPARLRISRSLRKTLRRGRFRVTFDQAFDEVIDRCSTMKRGPEGGTWITADLIAGFRALHRLGFAHSVESWCGDRLAGGLYGLSLGAMFCGESMFYTEPDASKVAFVHLVEQLHRWAFRLIDCQVHTGHLARFGAEEISRELYLEELKSALETPTRLGSWTEAYAEIYNPRSAE